MHTLKIVTVLAGVVTSLIAGAYAQDAWDHLYDIPLPDLDPMVGMDRGEEDWHEEWYDDASSCAPSSDALSARITQALAANGLCSLYSPERYAAFKVEVPRDKHYVVNYVAWVAGEPLLPPGQAARLDAQHFGPAQTVPAPAAPAERYARSEPDARRAPGACGVPPVDDYDLFAQEEVAKEGACAEYLAEREEQGGL